MENKKFAILNGEFKELYGDAFFAETNLFSLSVAKLS